MNHVGRRLLPPIFNPNIGHNQSASRIIALSFLTKNMSKESAFFVQRAHPYRAFLRNHIRTTFRVHPALTGHTVPTIPTALTVPTVPNAQTAPTSSTASTPSGRSTLLVLISNEQSKSKTSHSVESKSGLFSCYFYYNTRAFIYDSRLRPLYHT